MGFRLGIDQLSVIGLDPVEFVNLAADLGCGWISTGVQPMQASVEGFAPWSLRDDAALRRELKAALTDRGITLGCGEGFLVLPGLDADAYAGDIDILAELGAERINILSVDRDEARSHDQLAKLAGMIKARGLKTVIEFVPGLAIGDLPSTLAFTDAIGMPEMGIVIDAMHLFTSGGTAADVAALDPARIAYVQLCDTAAGRPADASYHDDAVWERDAPGDGELPIVDLLRAVPDGITLSFEVPQRRKAQAGVGPRERMEHCVDQTKRLLAEAGR